MNTITRTLACLLIVSYAAPALAQTNVSPASKFAWSENCGYLNFRDSGSVPGAQGARLLGSFAKGFIWGENIGYINLGGGTPTNGTSYANASGTDFGININTTTGALTGFAWGENVGWINFSGGALASPAQPARIDFAAGRLRGYAWGENIGWINLDDALKFVRIKCPADYNDSNLVSVQDVFDFVEDWFVFDPLTDFNFSGAITVQDIFDFLTAWFNGCA
jgi:hypothetical protein